MKRFILEQSSADIIGQSGLALVGQALKQHTRLAQMVDHQVPLRHGISHSDVLKSYIGLLCLGKNDFEAINTIDSELFFLTSLGLEELPSEPTLRQRMDRLAESFLPLVKQASWDFLANVKPAFELTKHGHIPLDADVTPMDNSGTRKEGVSRTYKGHDGYAPMAAYLGQEGYCLELELREGSQHCQNGTPALLANVLNQAARIIEHPLLVRLDGGNDALENVDVILEYNVDRAEHKQADFVIKWNPRREDPAEWARYADVHSHWEDVREGKRVSVFSIDHSRDWKGHTYTIRRVMRVVERTIDKKGQLLLAPELEMEGWWTSLDIPEHEVIQLYADHGTSEQFHSEFKSDMDVERLPSGKFATNALVLACSMLAFNLLRWVGQNGLTGPKAPRRHKAKRRRIKTVIQELMYVAARVVQSGRYLKLCFGKGCRSVDAFTEVYHKLAYG